MKYLKFKSYGKVQDDCYFEISYYYNLKVVINSKSQGQVAILNVNFDDLVEDEAVIDIKNCPFAESLIKDYGFGEHIGYTHLDHINYPIYKLDIDKMLKYGIEV